MSGKFCPVCKKKNDVFAAVCAYCGASMEFGVVDKSTTTRRMVESAAPLSEVAERAYIQSLAIPDRGIAFYLMDNASPIASREEEEFVLGRGLRTIGEEKLVDLTPFGGYENGVSHRHAMIRKTENRYEVIDLDSTNGTALNSKRIMPNVRHLLPSGSRLRLGKLVLYTVYNDPEWN
jgi:pSer/pThr/pTyr-binding forkhead associated (FHA) protein